MLKLLLVLLLIALNGFFSMSELAVITARRGRLKQRARTSAGARRALALAERPEQFLSAVQVWITLLGLLTGYFGGESLAVYLEAWLAPLPLIGRFAHDVAFVVCFGAILFLSVVLGELVPKRLGTLRPERVASWVAIPMHVLALIATPVVLLLSGSTRVFLRLVGLGRVEAEHVGEDEIRHVVAESHEHGAIERGERDMLNRVLRLGDRKADSLMTPRTRVAWLDANAPLERVLETIRNGVYARYPVVRGSDADVLGVLEVKRLAGRRPESMADLLAELTPAYYVSATTTALALLDLLREDQRHLALVVSEYGDVQGVVSLGDLLGAVMGRLAAPENAADEAPVVERADGSWLVDGRAPAEDLLDLLALDALPRSDTDDFLTAAGMVIAHFGRIPQVGEFFDWRGWRIEVVDLDGNRVDKLLIARVAPAQSGDESPEA